MRTYEEIQKLVDKKNLDAVSEYEQEIELAKVALENKRFEINEKKAKLDAELSGFQTKLDNMKYMRRQLTMRGNSEAMDIYKADLKAEYMPNETEEVFDKFFEMASEKAYTDTDIDRELEELLEFYQSIEKAKKG